MSWVGYFESMAKVAILVLSLFGVHSNPGICLGSGLEGAQAGSNINEQASLSPLTPSAIPPLYSSPVLPDEGVWLSKNMPAENGVPIIFKTKYRPSVHYPNAVAHMLLFDMRSIAARLYLGSAEEGGSAASARIERRDKANILAVTNGLWKVRHSGGGGIILGGKELKRLKPGLATLVVNENGSVDILEWNENIPISQISDARQLKHLIVSEAKIIESITRGGKRVDSEIGLGSLLNEAQPVLSTAADNLSGGGPVLNFTSGANWFIATRSAFGIREDGNLVFAVGHHISTKDLAKALALAGCVRGMHGDANPGNCVATVYRMDETGNALSLDKLSPQQDDFVSKRYLNGPVASDFYAFFKRAGCTVQQ